MKKNIVLVNLIPLELRAFRVSETVLSSDTLNAMAGAVFNDSATDDEWSAYDVMAKVLGLNDESTRSPGVEVLKFPFDAFNGDTVFVVQMLA